MINRTKKYLKKLAQKSTTIYFHIKIREILLIVESVPKQLKVTVFDCLVYLWYNKDIEE